MSAEMIYVSWGGTGRGAALRAAYDQAAKKLSDDVSNVTLEAIDDEELMRQMAEDMAGEQTQPDGQESVIGEALKGDQENS